MKIDAYNEQKRISEAYEKQDSKALGVKGTVSGRVLTDAVIFDKSGGDGGMFAASGYGMEQDGKSKQMSFEELADEASLLCDNMKAICNKTDMGEVVALDEEGIDINDVEAEKIVTVGEQIRIKLAASGNEHVYTGDLDVSDFEAVYGSSMAYMMADKLAQYNYPVTEDNMDEMALALMEAERLTEPDVSAKAYLMSNGLEPTVENLYTAEHAGAFSSGKNSLTQEEWRIITPQIKGMLSESGVEPDTEALDEIRSLLEGGVAITAESLSVYKAVSQAGEIIAGIHSQDLKTAKAYQELLADKMAASMVDLKSAKQADLSDEPTDWQKAKETMAVLDGVTADALEEFCGGTDSGKYGRTIEGLGQAEAAVEAKTAFKEAQTEERTGNAPALAPQTTRGAANDMQNPLDTYYIPQELHNVREIRQLLEVRLMMTFEAAYILEKNGFDVNTAQLSKLVEELRRMEETPASPVSEQESGGVRASFGNKFTELEDIMQRFGGLKTAPCDVIGQALEWSRVTAENIEKAALLAQREYEAAGRAYETMETQIRPDLGDRIGRAVVASTDNVLKELNLDNDRENQRAVRILAYNSMEITVERLTRVKEIDAAVNQLFNKMTPDIALDMLRDGTDIMGMGIEELSDEVDRRKQKKEIEITEKFSEFLYNLEKKDGISSQDREKYMALYTIVNKLIKDKGNAAGQLVNQDKDATLGNLVTAYMTRNGAGMDANTQEGVLSRGPEHNNAKLSYYKDLLSRLGETPKEAVEFVTENELPHTLSNLAAAGALYQDGACAFKGMKRVGVDTSLERFLQAMDSRETLVDSYEELEGQLKEVIEAAKDAGNMPDFRILRGLSGAMSLLGAMSRHNTFYIPYDADTGTGAIRLSVVENSDTAGSFTVDMQSEEYGHVQVSAKVENSELTAYILSEANITEEGTQVKQPLEAFMSRVSDGLKELGLTSVKIGASAAKEFPPVKNGAAGKTEVKKLFAAAKVFVENLR